MILISGPCIIEDKDTALMIAGTLKDIADRCDVDLYFKGSFDKANRSSINSYRGCGLENGLNILRSVKEELGIKVTTDIHLPDQLSLVDFVDVIQIPAFLCRQTDIIVGAAKTGKTVNVKKGQFLSPNEVIHIIEKVKSTGNENVWITERGTSFGYNRLVVDMTGIHTMKKFGVPIIIDATHSAQMPGSTDTGTGGNREFVETIALSALAAGSDGLFLEVYPGNKTSPSDASNIYELEKTEKLIKKGLEIFRISGKM